MTSKKDKIIKMGSKKGWKWAKRDRGPKGDIVFVVMHDEAEAKLAEKEKELLSLLHEAQRELFAIRRERAHLKKELKSYQDEFDTCRARWEEEHRKVKDLESRLKKKDEIIEWCKFQRHTNHCEDEPCNNDCPWYGKCNGFADIMDAPKKPGKELCMKCGIPKDMCVCCKRCGGSGRMSMGTDYGTPVYRKCHICKGTGLAPKDKKVKR